MNPLFSADLPRRGAWKKPLVTALLTALGLFTCWVLARVSRTDTAAVIVFAGIGVWLVAALAAYVRPNRFALALAVLGALLVGAGILTTGFGRAPCLPGSMGLKGPLVECG